MNIAMFTDSWLPTMDGAIATILKFRDGLEKRGHKVYIFAPEDLTGQIKEDDRTFLFKATEFKRYPGYRLAFPLSKRKDQLIREHDIEMIHNHGVAFMALKGMTSSRFQKLPILTHFHTWVTEAIQYYPVNLDEELMENLSWKYLRILCQRSDGVATPSNNALQELRKRVPDMPYSDWIFPGIDTGVFNPGIGGQEIRDRHDLADSEVILHVGRVSKEKNLSLILDAMPRIKKSRPDAKLLVVGSGPARDYYMSQVKEKGLENDVIFTGFVSNEDLPKYYAASDTFAIASKFETLGIVMTEALATGTPVAGINHRVVPEVIQDGYNGHLFEDDPEDCARQILACLDAPDEMRKNAIESANRFDTDKCMDKLESIYKRTNEIFEARERGEIK
jgi:1,2-diacylglycerol 3-alpha-glucosyltransferase